MSRRSPAIELQLPPGLRATRATRALVAWLRSRASSSFTAAETEAALARLGVTVNRVTVFRALDRLAQAGMLQRRVDDDRLTRYQWRGEAAQAGAAPIVPIQTARADSAAVSTAALPTLQFHCVRCLHDTPLTGDAAVLQDALQRLQNGLTPESAISWPLQGLQLQGVCAPCRSTEPPR